MIYVFENPKNGLVKIGFTKNPKSRINALSREAGCQLVPLILIEGDVTEERRLHRQFEKYHVLSEWFLFCEPIKSFIAEKANNDLTIMFSLKLDNDLAELRRIEGKTFGELAEIMGVCPPTVQQAEVRYKQKSMTIGTLEKHAKALGYRVVIGFERL